tara:strand:+ start:18422 stop:19483 length:1062 start_codon:yes stop_codon:yes gene_type:complete
MRLDTISIPNNQYVFSNQNQNTKLSFSLEEYTGSTSLDIHTIQIEEGTYKPNELAKEIQSKMNETMFNAGLAPQGFICKYNTVSNTIWFGNKDNSFTLRFDIKHDYGDSCKNQPDVFNKYNKWGLPSYIGYKKTIYQSTHVAPEYGFGYENTTKWLDGSNNNYVNVLDPSPVNDLNDLAGMVGRYGLCWKYPNGISPYPNTAGRAGGEPPPPTLKMWKTKAKINSIDIKGDDMIYMEIEKYNTMDEIAPYSQNTMSLTHNDYHGKTNSAFAKIPMQHERFSNINDSRTLHLMNVSQYQPPIENIAKLKFKFRYHDGRLVDFKSHPLSFSIEFNMLLNEQHRHKIVRIPGAYRL